MACAPPPCAKLSTTEHTGFLQAAWRAGLPEGKGTQGSDPAEGSCPQSTVMVAAAMAVVVEPLLGSSYHTRSPHEHSLI